MPRNAGEDPRKGMAMYIAMVVRNAMEDFHCEHLTDEQMRELNPIIRNAIYTALHASANVGTSEGADKFVEFQISLIPRYWEEPKLLDDYVETEAHFKKKATKKEPRRRKP